MLRVRIAIWRAVWGAMLAASLGGCVPHSLPLYAGQAAEITVDGSRFLVRFTDTRAEATRITPQGAPERLVILSRALRAIEDASGCQVRPGTLYGDTNLIEAYLTCPGKAEGALQPVQSHRPPL